MHTARKMERSRRSVESTRAVSWVVPNCLTWAMSDCTSLRIWQMAVGRLVKEMLYKGSS